MSLNPDANWWQFLIDPQTRRNKIRGSVEVVCQELCKISE